MLAHHRLLPTALAAALTVTGCGGGGGSTEHNRQPVTSVPDNAKPRTSGAK